MCASPFLADRLQGVVGAAPNSSNTENLAPVQVRYLYDVNFRVRGAVLGRSSARGYEAAARSSRTFLANLATHLHLHPILRGCRFENTVNYEGRGARTGLVPELWTSNLSLCLEMWTFMFFLPPILRGWRFQNTVNYEGRGARTGLGAELWTSNPSLYLQMWKSMFVLPPVLRGWRFQNSVNYEGRGARTGLGAELLSKSGSLASAKHPKVKKRRRHVGVSGVVCEEVVFPQMVVSSEECGENELIKPQLVGPA